VIGFHSIIYYSSTVDNVRTTRSRQRCEEVPAPTRFQQLHSAPTMACNSTYKMLGARRARLMEPQPATLRGIFLEVARPVTIDPATREPIENYHIRRVEKKDGRMQNVVIKRSKA
jgi:hypothetical protein